MDEKLKDIRKKIQERTEFLRNQELLKKEEDFFARVKELQEKRGLSFSDSCSFLVSFEESLTGTCFSLIQDEELNELVKELNELNPSPITNLYRDALPIGQVVKTQQEQMQQMVVVQQEQTQQEQTQQGQTQQEQTQQEQTQQEDSYKDEEGNEVMPSIKNYDPEKVAKTKVELTEEERKSYLVSEKLSSWLPRSVRNHK